MTHHTAFRAGEELEPVHTDYVTVLRISAAITATIVLIGACIAEIAIPGWTGVALVPWLLFAIITVWRMPLRRWSYRGYTVTSDRLRVAQGFLFRRDSVVPFSRVQHIDLTQGPLERMFGLATLIVHTAGTHNASVPLAGLKRDLAETMREDIRAQIRREAS